MTPSIRTLAFLVLLAVAVPVRGAGELTVLYPPDLLLTGDDTIKIYAFLPGGGPSTYVKVNGQPAAKLEGEEFRKGNAALGQGFNTIEVGGKAIRAYRLSGIAADQLRLPTSEGSDPVVFRVFALHPALDEGCEGCHTLEGGKLGAKDQKEACYACHADFGAPEEGKEKFLHPPVAAGECTGCHDPHFSARRKLQRLEKGCLECHDAPPAGGTVHYPVKAGECTACHGPHVGGVPKMLVRPGNALCAGCHEAPHAQHRSAAVKGTMTQVPDDFPREKGELSCLGCHAAHQSEERRLFRKPQGALCQMCHRV